MSVSDWTSEAGIASMTGAAAVVPLQFTGDFLWWAVAFFVLAVIAALAGFSGAAGISMDIARLLVLVFLVLAVISLLL
jgi:uncharacterized membrane protein YtjA (UPF0391 family)